MKASRPTIIEVRGSRLGLDVKGSRPRSRPSSAQMSEAGRSEERAARSRLQSTADAARKGRTTLLSRPRSAERPAGGAGSVRSVRPCSAVPRSVKTGPNSRRARRQPPPAGPVQTVVKHAPSAGGDSGGTAPARSADPISCGCSSSSLSRWTSSAGTGAPRRKGVTFSDTLSTDTGPTDGGGAAAAGPTRAGAGRGLRLLRHLTVRGGAPARGRPPAAGRRPPPTS
ncbi:translation initiation factor IF-2-like [Amphibalanus amphitrite]|uniref:translation initiation factor IF-2-like n=1 Tax=Amphibalanus amphitrite TaxID=1232801 RepID=UPI001C9131C5|nr:translation initiation factor IF-2-like [Amphibalanus amphitrite]XP_043222710.1 translation initiation factor IF-2-like [Amphibalanus amphitrite]XP_043222717.1 translation initiation factor IF-2-like [Amphibalanus amphitrite]XP_043222726.1 translation initiation factor IF-2-like [Amphibalanus amphitrite]